MLLKNPASERLAHSGTETKLAGCVCRWMHSCGQVNREAISKAFSQRECCAFTPPRCSVEEDKEAEWGIIGVPPA